MLLSIQKYTGALSAPKDGNALKNFSTVLRWIIANFKILITYLGISWVFLNLCWFFLYKKKVPNNLKKKIINSSLYRGCLTERE